MLTSELQPFKEELEKRFSDLANQIINTETKLNHEPLLSMIGKMRLLFENLKDDVQKLKE